MGSGEAWSGDAHRVWFDGTPDGVFVSDPGGRYAEVNDAGCRLLGRPREEILGRTVHDLIDEAHQPSMEGILAALRSEAPARFEWTVRHPDGADVVLDVTAMALPGGGRLSILRDVTAQAEARASLAESERRYRLLVNASGDLITITRDAVWEYLSPSVTDLLGYRPEELVGRPTSELIHQGDLERYRLVRASVVAGRASSARIRARHRDGSWHWLDVRGCADEEQPGVVLAAGRLIDDEMAALEALQASEEHNRVLAQRLERFIATTSHELRNPVAAIRGAVDVIDPARLDPAGHRAHEILQRQVDHLSRLLDDLLDIARAEQDQLTIEPVTVDLADVVPVAVEMARSLIDERQHRLELPLDPEPLLVTGDPKRLTQAVVNLLRNAAHYTPPGGTIRLHLERRAGRAVIRVTDTGIGLRPEAVDQLFQPFTRTPEAIRLAPSGLGIGLTLTQRIVQLHGGRIRATSDGPGAGTTVEIDLPLRAAATPEPAPPTAAGPTAAPTGRRILVVDDDPDVAEIHAELLTLIGHTVTTAATGAGALAELERARPEVVIVDLGLPDMTGYDLARELRLRPGGDDLVLISLSGWGGADATTRAAAAGIDHHLTKPATRRQLAQLPLTRAPATAAHDQEG